MKNLYTITTILFFSVSIYAGQPKQIDYYKNPPPADQPVIFAKNIISHPDTHEEKIAFANGGKEIFFGRHSDTSSKETYFQPKVMRTHFTKGQWSTPEVASFSKGRNLGWPMTSLNGRILLMEEYEGKIVKMEKINGKWSTPSYIQPEVQASEGFGLAQITDDNTFYFHDRYGRIAYSSKIINGKYAKPTPLSYMINPSVEFFVSRQNDYIIFRPINWGNGMHISFRTAKGDWDMPIPLRQYFKKEKWDTSGIGPNVSPDGKYFFFGKGGDIYWVTTDFIEVLRKYKRPY